MDSQQPFEDMCGTRSKWSLFRFKLERKARRFLDYTVPYRVARWLSFVALLISFFCRILIHQGFYIIAYAMSLHILYYFVLLLTPFSDPSDADNSEVVLPKGLADVEDGDFKPFSPKMHEFLVWKQVMTTVIVSLFLTLFPFLDIPIFWPILLIYFIVFLITQLADRIQHMIQYRYVPWASQKPKYVPKE